VLCTIVHRAVKTGAFGSLKFTENGAVRQLTYDFPLASTVTVFRSCYLIHDIVSYWSKLHTFPTSHAVFTIQYQYEMDRLSTIVCTMLWICTANAWHNENTTQSLQILSVWTICITLIITRGQSTLTQRLHRRHTQFNRICQVAPMCTPSSTCFLGPTRVHNPNGILIGSAIFAGLTIVTYWPTDRQTTLLHL